MRSSSPFLPLLLLGSAIASVMGDDATGGKNAQGECWSCLGIQHYCENVCWDACGTVQRLGGAGSADCEDCAERHRQMCANCDNVCPPAPKWKKDCPRDFCPIIGGDCGCYEPGWSMTPLDLDCCGSDAAAGARPCSAFECGLDGKWQCEFGCEIWK